MPLERIIGDGPIGDGGLATTWSIRQRIKALVVERLREILRSNGYQTDIGAHVYDNKDTPFQPTELAGANVTDTNTTERNIGEDWHTMTIGITAFSTAPPIGDAQRAIWADVATALGADETWGGLAQMTGTVSDPRPVSMQIGDRTVAGVELSFEIEYTTQMGSVYEQ